MELRHLRYFVAVATDLNFSKAAEKLLVAQPAVSKQIADLEQEIGTPLLLRTTRTVQLTAAGKMFLRNARVILMDAESAKDQALRIARGEAGEFKVGFFASPTMFFLPDLIRRYRLMSPEVTIQMRELTPDLKVTALLADGKIDIAFTRTLLPEYPNLEVMPLFQEHFYAVVAETHPLASRQKIQLSDLEQEPFVFFDRTLSVTLYDYIISACQEAGFSPDIVYSADLASTVLTMVAAEQGVSIVPETLQNLRSKQVSFVPIEPALDPITFIMCWAKKLDAPPRDTFIKLVREQRVAIAQNYLQI